MDIWMKSRILLDSFTKHSRGEIPTRGNQGHEELAYEDGSCCLAWCWSLTKHSTGETLMKHSTGETLMKHSTREALVKQDLVVHPGAGQRDCTAGPRTPGVDIAHRDSRQTTRQWAINDVVRPGAGHSMMRDVTTRWALAHRDVRWATGRQAGDGSCSAWCWSWHEVNLHGGKEGGCPWTSVGGVEAWRWCTWAAAGVDRGGRGMKWWRWWTLDRSGDCGEQGWARTKVWEEIGRPGRKMCGNGHEGGEKLVRETADRTFFR
jgi:hypothetical protein